MAATIEQGRGNGFSEHDGREGAVQQLSSDDIAVGTSAKPTKATAIAKSAPTAAKKPTKKRKPATAKKESPAAKKPAAKKTTERKSTATDKPIATAERKARKSAAKSAKKSVKKVAHGKADRINALCAFIAAHNLTDKLADWLATNWKDKK